MPQPAAAFHAIGFAAVLNVRDAKRMAEVNSLDKFTIATAGAAQDAIAGAVDIKKYTDVDWFNDYCGKSDTSGNIRPASGHPFNRAICEMAYKVLRGEA